MPIKVECIKIYMLKAYTWDFSETMIIQLIIFFYKTKIKIKTTKCQNHRSVFLNGMASSISPP